MLFVVNIKKTLDEGFENLEKGLSQQAKATVKAVAGQAGVSQGSQSQVSDQGSNEAAVQAAQQAQQAAIQSDEATREEVAAFYAPSNPNEKHGLSPQPESGGDAKEPSDFFKKQLDAGKTPEEAAQLEALRKKLHDEDYFIPLTERKPAEEEQEEEKKEEEQEKMEELQVKEQKKKQDDEVIKQSQQKTEKFPGASG